MDKMTTIYDVMKGTDENANCRQTEKERKGERLDQKSIQQKQQQSPSSTTSLSHVKQSGI